ncbi:MAG: (d)CMP kinase [Lachnospiraceae bacterium]|jgi:cytidylate kinase|nr:MAG: (d)CMP kinase [Lachnospiraceae bacterium]
MIIAFDGPAGSGKSTIAKIISEKLGITYLDTGAMYRAVTLYFLENNVDFNDENQVKINLEKIELEFINDKLYLNNKDVSVQIREKNVNDNVSFVSAIRIVREKMVDLQRKMSGKKSVVLDGRDIGTVVFPNADYKFYITASVDVRARRRYEEELEKGISNLSFDEVKKSMENRDYIDSNREVTPLRKADDAIEIDTSDMSIDEVLEKILSYIK